MKSTFKHIILFLFSFSILSAKAGEDCNMAISYTSMAYKQFKKAYTSSDPNEVQKLLKKGIEDANLAATYAIQEKCNCGTAKNYALDAVIYGQKALKETDHEKQLKLIKVAMDTSLDLMTAMNGCK